MAESRCEKNRQTEYAEVFKPVCDEAAYHNFPSEKYLTVLADQVPAGFRFGLKVFDAITSRKFPNLPRFGELGVREETIRRLVRRKVLRKLPGLRRVLIPRTEIHCYLNGGSQPRLS